MPKNEINTLEDLYEMLDRCAEGVSWETFYKERTKPASFLINNKAPDKCVVDFMAKHTVEKAVEFGCGEGRNAICLAQRGIEVDAFDMSETAISNAEKYARESNIESVHFEVADIFKKDFRGKTYDLVIDSGLFHHLAPHRRLHYREILKQIIRGPGYFILLCFAEGENAADEVDDCEFYKARRTGVAFSKKRIENFFSPDFEIIAIEKGQEISTPEVQENASLYKCLMKKR